MSVVRALAIRLRPFAPQLVLAGVCVAAASASTFGLVPLAKFAGTAFGHLTAGSLNTLVLGLIGLYAARSLFTFAQSALSAHVALELTARLREELFAHLLAQSLRFHQRQRVADLASRLVQDLGVLQQSLAALLAEFVPSVVVIAYALGYIVFLNWRLALCTFVGVPLVGLAIARFGARLHAISTQVQARVADVFVRAQESLAAILVVKAFGREAGELARFGTANRAHADALWRSALVLAVQSPAIAVLQTAALAGVLWVGGDEILHGRLASADLLAFAAAIGIAVDPTQ
ncbi:MAG TPA: ABC transporter transmembrane domain-containing protein, partial [Oscillatoriaceae cyanobacterium]